MSKKKVSRFEKYLTEEIGVEFKACLYFFCILFFYAMYRVLNGNFEASIVHMAEMILLTYGMCYVQLYFMNNFDEGERFGLKEVFYTVLCVGIYAGISYFGKWFDRNLAVTGGYAAYMMFAYVCAFLVYKAKRDIDGKLLNEDLKAFQERREGNE